MISMILHRPLGALTTCATLVILGLVAFYYIPINLYPQTRYPVLTISTALSDSSPEEIERLITKPMEEAIADLPGLRRTQSLSHHGESEITIQFHYGQDISEKALEVRSRIRRIFPILPKDARFPIITRYDPQGAPAIVLALSGNSSQEEIGRWVYQTLKPQLSRIAGVATVKVSGAPRSQINVECDPARLKALSLSIQDVAEAIGTGHKSLPAGFINIGESRFSVVTTGKLDNPVDIARQPVRSCSTGAPITVGELARVTKGSERAREIARYNGQSLIAVSIYRSPEADLRSVWREVKNLLNDLPRSESNAPHIEVITNQAIDLETILTRSQRMIALTAFITAGVLFPFIGSLRSTAIVLTSIPFSLCVAVLLIKLFGVTFDLLSLGGTILGLGILVDNAIVVTESICRKSAQGADVSQAIMSSSTELARPLILSTLTTVIVFVPVVFISREVRLLFVGFAWTVASSLLASLIASLIVVPLLFLLTGSRIPASSIAQQNASWFSSVSQKYRRMLIRSANHPRLIVSLGCLLLVLGILCARGLTFLQSISTDVRHYEVYMVLAPGTASETVAAKARPIESRLLQLPGVEGVYTEIQGNQGRFTISLSPDGQGRRQGQVMISDIEALLKDQEGAQFHVVALGRGGGEAQLSLNIQGPSTERLMSLQETLRQSLRQIRGIKDVMIRQSNPSPVLEFAVKHELAGFRGVSASDLAYHLRGHLTGPVAAKLVGDDGITFIRVRAMREREDSLDAVGHGMVPNNRGEMVPFMELVKPSTRLAIGELHRENRRPVLRMTLLLDQEDLLTVADRVTSCLKERLEGSGCDYSFGDEMHDVLRTRKEMLASAGTGLILIFVILVIATESLVQPLMIMSAVPMGLTGAAIILRLFNVGVSLPVYVGFMILCGLIVNVNVVLIYTINRLIRQGVPLEQAVVEGTEMRFRPVVMTVLTTVFASVPMLLDRGAGASVWSPFALTLAAGIIFGGTISLIMTPVLYRNLERLKIRMRGVRNR